jgi:hypothetical protein
MVRDLSWPINQHGILGAIPQACSPKRDHEVTALLRLKLSRHQDHLRVLGESAPKHQIRRPCLEPRRTASRNRSAGVSGVNVT